MKRLLFAVLLSLTMISLASATVTVKLISGATTVTCADGQGCDTNGLSNKVGYTNADLNGWEVDIVTGLSFAPSTIPTALDLHSLIAYCVGSACLTTPLEVLVSDTNFTDTVGGFFTHYSATITGGGTTTETAYVDTTNTLFGEPGSGLIGSISGGAPGFSTTVSGGGAAGPSAYSLTLDQVFNSNGTSGLSNIFSVDGNIFGTPEPFSIALFGSVVILCASKLRKRLS